MKDHYDFTGPGVRKNPYVKRLKKQITIRLGVDVLEYFRALAEETDMPYQTLIDMYLRDCVMTKRRLNVSWEDPG